MSQLAINNNADLWSSILCMTPTHAHAHALSLTYTLYQSHTHTHKHSYSLSHAHSGVLPVAGVSKSEHRAAPVSDRDRDRDRDRISDFERPVTETSQGRRPHTANVSRLVESTLTFLLFTVLYCSVPNLLYRDHKITITLSIFLLSSLSLCFIPFSLLTGWRGSCGSRCQSHDAVSQ